MRIITTTTLTEALSLLRRGQAAAASALLEKIVAAQPRNAEAWFVLAGVHHGQRSLDAAARGYEKVIALNPRHADAHYFLGNIRGGEGDHEAAMRCYRAALELQPFAQAARNLGALLHRAGRVADAIACYRRFLDQSSGTADIYLILRNAISESGVGEEAIAFYREALRLDPTRAALHVAIGDLQDEAGSLDLALAEYQLAFAAAPDSPAACGALGAALADQGRPEEAVATYMRLAARSAGLAVRAATVLPAIARDLEDLGHWRVRYASEIARLAGSSITLADPAKEVGSSYFFLSYHGLCNRDLNSQLAGFYSRACPSLTWTAPHCARTRKPGRTRVGFISRFLHEHSIGRTTRGLLAELSRDEFEAIALFAPPARDDEMARAIRASSDRPVVLPGELDAARRAIAELQLDVLFYQDIG